jgi:hypothetical protein
MRPVGFEPTVSASERPQTYALDSAATGTGTTGFKNGREGKYVMLHDRHLTSGNINLANVINLKYCTWTNSDETWPTKGGASFSEMEGESLLFTRAGILKSFLGKKKHLEQFSVITLFQLKHIST